MSSELTPLIFVAVVFLIFWFVVARPASRQRKQQLELQRVLAVGDRVVISAGIFGTVQSLDDARARLEVAPGVEIEVARQVVVRRVDDEVDTAPAAPAEDADRSADRDPGSDSNADAETGRD